MLPADLPRNVELLLKKAAVDPPFRAQLLAQPAATAAAYGLQLSPSESALLAAASAEQLEAAIRALVVPPALHEALRHGTPAAAAAALEAPGPSWETIPCTGIRAGPPTATGSRPEMPFTPEPTPIPELTPAPEPPPRSWWRRFFGKR